MNMTEFVKGFHLPHELLSEAEKCLIIFENTVSADPTMPFYMCLRFSNISPQFSFWMDDSLPITEDADDHYILSRGILWSFCKAGLLNVSDITEISGDEYRESNKLRGEFLKELITQTKERQKNTVDYK